jgi:hypothetical protein
MSCKINEMKTRKRCIKGNDTQLFLCPAAGDGVWEGRDIISFPVAMRERVMTPAPPGPDRRDEEGGGLGDDSLTGNNNKRAAAAGRQAGDREHRTTPHTFPSPAVKGKINI